MKLGRDLMWWNTRLRTSPDRVEGDQARDDGRPEDAAEAYRRHLGEHPRDFAIWVQLGHALKDDHRRSEALKAYERAAKLRRRDADLLLNIGHLHRLNGDFAAAASFYRRSLAQGDKRALESLAHPEFSQQLDQTARAELFKANAAALKAVAGLCTGIRPTAVNDLMPLAGGGFRASTSDPWIELALDEQAKTGLGGELSMQLHRKVDNAPGADAVGFGEEDAEQTIADHNLVGQIYIDYGNGYSEARSINLAVDGLIRIVILSPDTISRLRWDPINRDADLVIDRIGFTPLAGADDVRAAIVSVSGETNSDHAIAAADEFLQLASPTLEDLANAQDLMPPKLDYTFNYKYWRRRYMQVTPEDYDVIDRMTSEMPVRPSFSFVMPVYNPPPDLLRECIQSMLRQTYADFEICIADDNSPNPEIREVLLELADQDDRIKLALRERNGHISAASNSALALASNDFVVLVDHDDLIPDYALFVIAHYINLHPDALVLFSDEDKVTPDGEHFQPYFKSEFNRFLMFGHNMVSHIGVYQRALLEEIGGFRLGLEGSQDYDLFLRCYERARDEQIVHIPHILYHWRAIPGSTAVSADQKGYAIFAAQAAINGYFERGAIPLRSRDGFAPGCTSISATADHDTRLSIIIPTRDGLDVLRPCIASILKTPHANIEILVVDNGSTDPETLEYLAAMADEGAIRVLRYDQPFNFSSINNFGVEHATGELICFLNNDTEVTSPRWIDRARALLSLPEIGAVGARLLFPDGHLQHFGIALGMGAHRVAGTPHSQFPGHEPGYFGKARLIQECSAVTAACLFMRKADFLAIGGFDPELRVAYNDVDLCLKVRRAGFKIVVDPDISLIHKESRSRGSDKGGENARRLDAEAAEMRKRWARELDNDPYYSPNLSLERMDFALAFPPRQPLPWQV